MRTRATYEQQAKRQLHAAQLKFKCNPTSQLRDRHELARTHWQRFFFLSCCFASKVAIDNDNAPMRTVCGRLHTMHHPPLLRLQPEILGSAR